MKSSNYMLPIEDKIKGCLIGSAIGDGFGYPTEFMNIDEIKSKWGENGLTEPIGEIIKVTDDTQMTIAVSNAIMQSYEEGTLVKNKFETELIREFILWLNDDENNRAPGMTCLKSCENLEKGMKWQDATAKNSKGCGANMRVTPLGILKFKSEKITDLHIAKWSQLQSAITHAHPTALVASELTSIAIIKIIEGVEPTNLVDVLIEYSYSQKNTYHKDFLQGVWERVGVYDEIDFIKRGWDECISILRRVEEAVKLNDTETDPCEYTGEGWIAEESLATGLLCFLLYPNDSVKALIRAVNTKGDSDSIACITGAFAGARNGLTSFPIDWVERIEYKEELDTYLSFVLENEK